MIIVTLSSLLAIGLPYWWECSCNLYSGNRRFSTVYYKFASYCFICHKCAEDAFNALVEYGRIIQNYCGFRNRALGIH
jgi:hypothetical protein